jgi:hypothetical protein
MADGVCALIVSNAPSTAGRLPLTAWKLWILSVYSGKSI